MQKNCRYISMLRYFARNIKGSDNYWRSRTNDPEQWINHHVGRGHGPPTYFITLSCAKNWWPDLRRLLYQLERIAGNSNMAEAIRKGGRKEMANSATLVDDLLDTVFCQEGSIKFHKSSFDTLIPGHLLDSNIIDLCLKW